MKQQLEHMTIKQQLDFILQRDPLGILGDTKLEAFAKHLKVSPNEIEEVTDHTFDYGGAEYLVLTDAEADAKAKECILNSVWAFRPEFLAAHTSLDADIIEILQKVKHEDANELLLKVIAEKDHFVDDAINADGRGHFLSIYDGEEHEQGEFYIYRVN